MRRPHFYLVALGTVVLAAAGCASNASNSQAPNPTTSTGAAATTTSPPNPIATNSEFAPGRRVITLDVAGTSRTAVLVVPASATEGAEPAPVVFAFHGHGGSGARFERKLDVESSWANAIVVYPDGLPGHAGRTDPQGVKPGWQIVLGEGNDRDLAFYDALLAALRANLHVDDDRIYVVGHSNGSAFTSLLLHERGDEIAATATLSAQPTPEQLATDPTRSMFMAIGEHDAIVSPTRQQARIPLVRDKLDIDPATTAVDGYLTTAYGPNDLELATYLYPGGHAIPDAVPPLVVAFFQRHSRADG